VLLPALCARRREPLLSLRQRHRLREPVGLPILRVLPLRPFSSRFYHRFGLGAGFRHATNPADLGLIEAAHVYFTVDPAIGYEEAWVALWSLQLLVQRFHRRGQGHFIEARSIQRAQEQRHISHLSSWRARASTVSDLLAGPGSSRR
jgi:hypothetical protein